MSFTKVLFLIAIFWTVIHGIHYFLKSRKNSSILPVASRTAGHHPRIWNAASTSFVVDKLLLRIQTTSLNAWHDSIANRLKTRQCACIRYWTVMFYNLGVFFGLLGMICALGVLLYTAGSSVWGLLLYQIKTPETQVSHVKRALVEEETIQTNSASEGFIQPIVRLRPPSPRCHLTMFRSQE